MAVEYLVVGASTKAVGSAARDLGPQPDRHAIDAADRGSSITGIGTPEGSFAIGGYTFSTYRLVLFLGRCVLIGLM